MHCVACREHPRAPTHRHASCRGKAHTSHARMCGAVCAAPARRWLGGVGNGAWGACISQPVNAAQPLPAMRADLFHGHDQVQHCALTVGIGTVARNRVQGKPGMQRKGRVLPLWAVGYHERVTRPPRRPQQPHTHSHHPTTSLYHDVRTATTQHRHTYQILPLRYSFAQRHAQGNPHGPETTKTATGPSYIDGQSTVSQLDC